MPKFTIHHVTKYNYEEAVRDSANQIMLFPVKDEYQEVNSQYLIITGEPVVEIFKDYYGNDVGTFMNITAHTELKIDSKISIITKPRLFPPDDIAIEEQWNHLSQLKNIVPFIDFLKQENFLALGEVRQILDAGFYKSVSVYVAVLQLTQYVYQEFKYIKGITSIETTPDEIWQLKAGVCQDFAHILLVTLRLLGIPARYVSGYVCPVDNDLRGEGATHAWVEAYIRFFGWLGFDPTNNCIVNDQHVRLAIGRNFSDCSPVKGTYKGTSKQALEVGVSVSRENGNITKQVIIEPQPVTIKINEDGSLNNSYRNYMDMVQQQQQQQQ